MTVKNNIFLFIITIVLLMTFIPLTICSGGGEYEIRYDDGGFEAYFWWINPSYGYMIAVKFTPPEKPSKLLKALFYINNPSQFKVRVFDENRWSLLDASANPTRNGWYTVDLSDFNIIVKGDFYIALEYISGSSNPRLGGDTSRPDGRSYWVSPGDGWVPVKEIAETKGEQWWNVDFGIRAVVTPVIPVTIDFNPRVGSVVVDGTTYNADKLPLELYYTPGSTFTVQIVSEIVSASTGTRYVFNGWSDGSKEASRRLTVSRELRLTGYWKKQYLLSVSSEHGSVSGGGWYDEEAAASISISETEVPGRRQGERFIFVGWGGDIQSATPSASVRMNSPKTVYARWKTQYYLTVESNYGNPQGEGWYDAGHTASFKVAPSVDHHNSTRRIFLFWSGDSQANSTESSIAMNSPKRVTANWKKQYYVGASSSLSGFIGGNNWYDEGSKVTIRLNETAIGFPIQDVFDHFEGCGAQDKIIGDGILEVYVDCPKHIIAIWRKEYTQLIILIVVISIVVVMTALLWKRKSGQKIEKTYPTYGLPSPPAMLFLQYL